MAKQHYPRELNADEWASLEPLIRTSWQPRYSLHIVVNTILFKFRSGCAWRRLPDDRPPWWTVYYYFRKWCQDGTWERIIHELHRLRRRKPKDRGGRPRLPVEAEPSPQETPAQYPKPDIVCWERGRQWILGVELPEGLLERPDLELSQDGLSLSQDDSYEERWRLKQATGEVVVRLGKQLVSRRELATESKNYLLFKLRGPKQDQGRRVKSLSYGSFLLVAPEKWERAEDMAGPAPAAPEPVSVEGYKAHFFDIEQGGSQRVAFRTADGNLVRIETRAPRFQLIGNQLPDANEEIGPLFGGGPPRIRALDASDWNEIMTIIVGEEGKGKGKWRTQFKPAPELMEQELPVKLSDRKGGWYFVRLYDKQDDLLDSFDFRFLCALKDIRVSQQSPLPAPDGHKPCRVEFSHEPGCIVQPVDKHDWDIHVQPDEGQTVVVIPPDPTCDRTRWRVSSNGTPSVEVTIQVERVWWALGEEKTKPSEWGAQPFTLSRGDFRATSNKAVWICLPREHWTKAVRVGFAQQRSQRFPVRASERTVCIPLRGFGDASELSTVGETALKLWLDQGDSHGTTIAYIRIKAACQYCDFLADREEELLPHIGSQHLGQLFQPLTYEQLRDLDPTLPPAIYVCLYCEHYVKAGGIENPTSAILHHFSSCPRAPRQGGPPTPKFRIVDNVEEIRAKVISSLPRIHRCQLCNADLKEPGEASMLEHLRANHGSALWQLR